MAVKINKVVGIDLGTTNSVIAMMGPDNKTILCNTDAQGRRSYPSAVVWDKRSESIKSGQLAFNRRGTTPEPVTSIKRRMGDPNFRAVVGELEMSPIEVSAEILRDMKNQMQNYLAATPGCENYVVDRAVITIPAYFRSEASEATAKAGELAGFEVVKTLQEPSSASAFYCWKNGIEDGVFMVYDLGGGTFDVSIIQYAAGDASVLGIAGNNYLGGDTFDELLSKMLLDTLQDEGYFLDLQPDDEKDRQRLTKLRLAAEVIKKALSEKEEYYHTHDGIFTDHEGATVNLAITVTRKDFEALIEPVLSGTLEKCQEALKEAEQKEITLDMIDGVLLVGGSTHIPLVKEFVRKNFCDESLVKHTIHVEPLHEEPDMAVGFGASVTASGFPEITFEEAESGEKSDDTPVFAAEVQPGIGIGGKSVVIGVIKPIKGSLPDQSTAKVAKADGSFQAEFPINENGKFKFTGLPAPTEDEPYQCSIEANGESVFSFKFNAAAATIQPPPTTLSHSLYVETVDVATGKISRSILMEKGTNLPTSCEYQFMTTQEYSVIIKVYEDNTQLCNINMPFENPVPIGSPVVITLEIDEKSTKHVHATAAGQSEDVYLEAPPLEPVTEGNIREKLSEFDSKTQSLSQAQKILANAQEHKLKQLEEESRQAIAEDDQVRAKEAFDEMSKIVSDIAGGAMEPPESEFHKLAEKCISLNREHHDNSAENAEKIRACQERGAAHYAQMNQDGVTAEYQNMQQLHDFLDVSEAPATEHPKWAIVKFGLCTKIREDMRKADENPDIPPQLRMRMETERTKDEALVDKIDNDMSPITTEEEAVAAIVDLRPVMTRWEEYAGYDPRVSTKR